MKLHFFLSLGILATVLAPLSSIGAPELPAERAVKLAQDDLKGRGFSEQYHIASLVLQKRDVRGSGFYWAVNWSSAIPLTAEKKELGLQIGMDGSLVRVVRGAANKNPQTGTFDPNGSTGLQNYRTRSDRPSILNLKH